jgi:TolB-like protein/DNA-binding winged helix-turn-helix (wHTH) protein/tetratricopeptide (TPR) repeat protein
LLIALARAAPNIATLDDLMRQVWPRSIVSPETLSKRVNLLRDALGDDSQEPRYIAGVRGRGYRLVSSVESLHEPSVAPERHRHWPRPIAVATALVAACALAAVSIFSHRAPRPTQPPPVAGDAPPRSIAVLPFKDLGGGQNGDILALGIPEAVLHQLASIETLEVIARTSSFSFQGHDEDIRAIGHQLNARYILEGSVQRDGQRLRVTTQLVNAQTGGHVWSMQFDKAPQGIFELQDAIALEVARALSISLDPGVTLKRQGSTKFEAYLEYMQGARQLATWRTAGMKDAAEHAARALSIDPDFAAAYVLLASSKLRIAEYSASEKRELEFREALRDARGLLDHALFLDAKEGRAYAERGYVNAFSDLAASEADYRKALEINPSDAQASEGLAAVLYENPARRDEALMLIDKARKLDPLEPRLDVVKATFVFYGRSELDDTEKLLKNALQRDPLYEPALSRLAELYWIEGRYSEGIKIAEQVVAADVGAVQPRQILYYLYLEIQDLKSAESIARAAPSPRPTLMASLYLAEKKWVEAGNQALRAASLGTITPVGEPLSIAALRMHARATKHYLRAIDLLTERSHTEWDAADQPIVRDSSSVYCNVVGLADMLIQGGQVSRGRRLLEATLAAMDREEADFGTGSLWHHQMRSLALALLGRNDETIAELQRSVTERLGLVSWWYNLELEPAYANVRRDPKFQDILAVARERAAGAREAVAKLVASGLVPDRTKPN